MASIRRAYAIARPVVAVGPVVGLAAESSTTPTRWRRGTDATRQDDTEVPPWTLAWRLAMTTDRRKFLQMLGTTAAAGAFAAPFTTSIRRALAVPANHRTGTIADVEHIVFLMQENRSFDHYFGTMRGVRGFGDPRAVRLPNGVTPTSGRPSRRSR
jgi:hypothetical protein